MCAIKYQEAQHCLPHAGKLIGLFLIHDDYDGIDLRPRVPLITRLCDYNSSPCAQIPVGIMRHTGQPFRRYVRLLAGCVILKSLEKVIEIYGHRCDCIA